MRDRYCVMCGLPSTGFSSNGLPVCDQHPDATDRKRDWDRSGFIDGGPVSQYPVVD